MNQQEYARLATLAEQRRRIASEHEPAGPDQVLETAAQLAREQGAERVWIVDASGNRQRGAARRVELDRFLAVCPSLAEGRRVLDAFLRKPT